MIAHLRVIPGLWIAVEEQRRPEIRSHPVIMGGVPQQRGVVREVNLAAHHCGVQAGMTLSQAYQHCPDGLFLAPDLPVYQRVWEEICDLLGAYTPLVESIEMGQAACDLSGCERRRQGAWNAAREMASQVRRHTGIAPSIGVASNRFVAQLASLSVGPERVTMVEAGHEPAFLADLPISLLPDLDPRLALTFQALGLRTLGQLAALPASAVKRRFGAAGERLHAYARGVDPRPVVPSTPRPAVTARYECEDGTLEEAVVALRRLAATCASELQQRRLAGHLVTLTLFPPPAPSLPASLPSPDEPAGCLEAEAAPAAALSASTDAPQLPVPYRIHSMLPQPAAQVRPPTAPPAVCPAPPPSPSATAGARPAHALRAIVRTPIDSAAPLLERAQQLLLKHWPRPNEGEAASWRIQALELAVSEFEPPTQLSFAEFNRLDQTGMLAGLDANRRRALEAQEQVLLARYGDASFCHVARLDPGNILTERRVHWQAGLPWSEPAGPRPPSTELPARTAP